MTKRDLEMILELIQAEIKRIDQRREELEAVWHFLMSEKDNAK